MNISFSNTPIDKAPREYVRMHFTEADRGTVRIVREGKIESIEIGTGPRARVTRRSFITLCRAMIRAAKQTKTKQIAVQLDRSPFPALKKIPLPELASLIAQNAEMANFEFTALKSKPKGGWNEVAEILVCGETPKAMREGFKEGLLIGKEVNACRVLANTPGGDMTPTSLASAAKSAAKGLPITVQVLTPAQMKTLGMGAVLGVAKGSAEAPAFIIMQYKGAPGAPVLLAGKGVTFDSGGINLKSDGGIDMHLDMSGGAAVIHALVLAAKLKVKKHVVALVPAVENMPSGASYRPGDVLRSLSGKTIEIGNTDAEGRVILADALTYAKRFKPSVVVDVATLTGAACVALGPHANAVMSRDDALANLLTALAEETGDYAWRMPLWDEYENDIRGTFGDVVNAQSGSNRQGGAINAGMFLWQFAKELDCPWAHIDIAPRMTPAAGEELSKGATGTPVRQLLAFIRAWT